MSRITRIAIRLIAQLEGLHVHKDDTFSKSSYFGGVLKRHEKVAELEKTKGNLEKWFAAREIPIRIVYASTEHLSAIPAKGVITFFYEPMTEQEPPTAWMIIHNLAHGIFDKIERENPHLLQHKADQNYAEWSQKTIRDMRLSPSQHPDKDTGDARPNTTYPTTRSALNDAIASNEEAFYEIFTQWVTTGHVHLQSQDQFHARRWEQRLEHYFRDIVDEVAAMGVVIHNI